MARNSATNEFAGRVKVMGAVGSKSWCNHDFDLIDINYVSGYAVDKHGKYVS